MKELSTKSNLQILHEDNHIIVVNKRVGDIVQGDKTGDKPLSEIVKEYIKDKYSKPGEALANLDVKQAQRFANACHGIARDLLNLIYIPETNQFHIEEKAS